MKKICVVGDFCTNVLNTSRALQHSIKDTCPDAGLSFKGCGSIYAIPSALFPGHNVSLIGNCINSHEFARDTKLSKEDTVSLAM